MTEGWSADELAALHGAGELEIAVGRARGGRGRWVPIWVVVAGGQAYVRSWYRRDTGWFGRALRVQRARVRVPGLEAEVHVVDVGATSAEVTAEVDAAYREKYGRAGSMTTADAQATTLRLEPSSP